MARKKALPVPPSDRPDVSPVNEYINSGRSSGPAATEPREKEPEAAPEKRGPGRPASTEDRRRLQVFYSSKDLLDLQSFALRWAVDSGTHKPLKIAAILRPLLKAALPHLSEMEGVVDEDDLAERLAELLGETSDR